jgi:glycosyltransferase involved in cell wall biosynthesis
MTETLERPPLCSIALATFNGSRFLREQLDSLLGQSHGNLEIVVSDDQSVDDTAAHPE